MGIQLRSHYISPVYTSRHDILALIDLAGYTCKCHACSVLVFQLGTLMLQHMCPIHRDIFCPSASLQTAGTFKHEYPISWINVCLTVCWRPFAPRTETMIDWCGLCTLTTSFDQLCSQLTVVFVESVAIFEDDAQANTHIARYTQT